MDSQNTRFSERAAILAVVNPASQGAGTANSGWIPVSLFDRIVAELMVGAFGASATVDAKFQQATSSGGAGAKDITGKAITQMVAAGGNNRQAIVEVSETDLDVNNGFAFVQFSVTVGTAATLIAATVKGVNARYQPASAYNATSVAQVV
jgi:hypothetical protein